MDRGNGAAPYLRSVGANALRKRRDSVGAIMHLNKGPVWARREITSSFLEETRQTAKRELAALQNRKERMEALERARDTVLEDYAGRTPEPWKPSHRKSATDSI